MFKACNLDKHIVQKSLNRPSLGSLSGVIGFEALGGAHVNQGKSYFWPNVALCKLDLIENICHSVEILFLNQVFGNIIFLLKFFLQEVTQ